MARFKNLSEAIRSQIPAKQQFPAGSPIAFQTGDNIGYTDINNTQPSTDVFRWGYSVWGVDTITGQKSPQDIVE